MASIYVHDPNTEHQIFKPPIIDLPSRSSCFDCRNDFWENPLIQSHFPILPNGNEYLYTLDKLCDIRACNKSNSVQCLTEWLRKEIKEFQGFKYTIRNDEDYTLFEKLAAFGTSTEMIPDISILRSHGKESLPVLLFDVVSGNEKYSTTLARSVASLIYQLRYLSHFSRNYVVDGFVFPKRLSKSPITKITLEWKELRFRIDYTFLRKDEIIDAIQSVVNTQCEADYEGHISGSFLNFIYLNDDDLKYLGRFTKSTHQRVSSAYSILTKDENYYYKIVPFWYCRSLLLDILMELMEVNTSSVRINRLVLPRERIRCNTVSLFLFEALPHQPLVFEEFRSCLTDFVRQVVDALLQLHDFGYAHTDIRLPNFCFSNDYTLKLIDFDRAKIATELAYSDADSRTYFPSDPPNGRSIYKAIDFKQLGIHILSVTHPTLSDDNWVALRTNSADSANLPVFLRMLIGGIYSKDHHDEWHNSVSSDYPKTIDDILRYRSGRMCI